MNHWDYFVHFDRKLWSSITKRVTLTPESEKLKGIHRFVQSTAFGSSHYLIAKSHLIIKAATQQFIHVGVPTPRVLCSLETQRQAGPKSCRPTSLVQLQTYGPEILSHLEPSWAYVNRISDGIVKFYSVYRMDVEPMSTETLISVVIFHVIHGFTENWVRQDLRTFNLLWSFEIRITIVAENMMITDVGISKQHKIIQNHSTPFEQ